jgi:hypothetical protein
MLQQPAVVSPQHADVLVEQGDEASVFEPTDRREIHDGRQDTLLFLAGAYLTRTRPPVCASAH